MERMAFTSPACMRGLRQNALFRRRRAAALPVMVIFGTCNVAPGGPLNKEAAA